MRFLSLCSGIEAASVAFGPLGWHAVAFSEIEPFPRELLAYRYPHVANLGDMTRWREWPEQVFIEADLVVGGPPCQAFSVAGSRAGLADARGNLTITYADLIDHADAVRARHGKPPVIALYENVPGLLSSADNAFGCLLAGLAGEDEPLQPSGRRWTNAGLVCGPRRAVAWRVLDAQYAGLAQRRRRVFVVASARDGFDPGAVLFEFDGVRRDSPPRRETREGAAGGAAHGAGASGVELTAKTLLSGGHANNPLDENLVAGTLDARTGGGFPGTDGACANRVVATSVAAVGGNRSSGPIDVTTALTAHQSGTRLDFESDTFLAVAFAENSRAELRLEGGDGQVAGALKTGGGKPGQSYPCIAVGFNARQDPDAWSERTGPLDTFSSTQAVGLGAVVRRLTPVECERLQGFPDNYTRIPDWNGWRAMDASETPEACRAAGLEVRQSAKTGRWRVRDVDGPRYKALGNSWAVLCVRRIGRRITAHLGEVTCG